MKSIVIFYEEKDVSLQEKIGSTIKNYAEEKVFDGKSAKDLAFEWANKFSTDIVVLNCEKTVDLLAEIKTACEKYKADNVIYSYIDLPFLNEQLTRELLEVHEKYNAEYTFEDGYPYGFAPVVIDAGTVAILAELAKTSQIDEGNKFVCRESIFNLIKTDINSFELETVLAPDDWRLFRFNFSCGKKENFIACKELFKQYKKGMTVAEISKLAAVNPAILKTVPGFYNIQIVDYCKGKCIYCPYPACFETKNKIKVEKATGIMSFEKYSSLIEQISFFSENAVISFSAWGEPMNHPNLLQFLEKTLEYSGLSVFMETDGLLLTEEFCSGLKEILSKSQKRTNGWQPVMIAVSLDAFSNETYKKLHGLDNVNMEQIVNNISKLYEIIPGAVYPQFVRMNENEEELESFFRYWKNKTNASGGELIIQKYDDFAKMLPECKPADLSPIDRNICWHLRRDITILTNGDVPVCREYVLDGIVGNVFTESLESIWKKTDSILLEHINNKYNQKCRNCDEYYTYNF